MYSDIFSSKPPTYYVPPTRGVKVMHYTLLASFFLGIVFLAEEIDSLDNTINGLSFFFISVLTGIISGLVFALLVDFLSPVYKLSRDFSKALYLGSVMAFGIMIPPSACFINRYWAASDTKPVHFKISRKDTDSKHSSFFVFVTVDHDDQRFTVPRGYYERMTVGMVTTFYIKHGALSYDFVMRFE